VLPSIGKISTLLKVQFVPRRYIYTVLPSFGDTYNRVVNLYFVIDGGKIVTCVQVEFLYVGPLKMLLIVSLF